jgi:hypothetical protein
MFSNSWCDTWTKTIQCGSADACVNEDQGSADRDSEGGSGFGFGSGSDWSAWPQQGAHADSLAVEPARMLAVQETVG